MKLEFKHIAHYLLYRLKCYVDGYGIELIIGATNDEVITTEDSSAIDSIKPILRPLSDLTKPIIVEGYNDGKEFIPAELIEERFIERFKVKGIGDGWQDNITEYLYTYPYGMIDLLFRLHFDVFGLIEKGLAIDINTLTPTK